MSTNNPDNVLRVMNDNADERILLKQVLNEIERTCLIHEYRVGKIHLWPIFRLFIFMDIVTKGVSRPTRKKKEYKAIFNEIYFSLYSILKYLLVNKNHTIFVGHPYHGAENNGIWQNKYFDFMMDDYEESVAYFTTYDGERPWYKQDRHVYYSKLLNIANKYINSIDIDYVDMPVEIDEILQRENISYKKIKYKQFLKKVLLSYRFHELLFKNKNIKSINVLSYYSPDVLGIVLAGNVLNIETIDYQHGSQGPLHLAYSSWINLPTDGYLVLPRKYFTWDEYSKNEIEKWVDGKNHSAVLFGNPWIKSWKNNRVIRRSEIIPKGNNILLALQPLENPIDDFVINAIKQTHRHWKWYVRLHPRQLHDYDRIKNIFVDNMLDSVVEIDISTSISLPEMLSKTSLVISKYSGCIIEAADFGIPCIIIDERGKELLPDSHPMKVYLSIEQRSELGSLIDRHGKSCV